MTNEELVVNIQRGNTDLLPELWDQVRLLICRSANRFFNQNRERCDAAGATVDDLTQEGFFAFMDAVRYYDPAKDYKFCTYLSLPLKKHFATASGGRENNRREPLNISTSLDSPISDDDGGIALVDTIADPIDEYDRCLVRESARRDCAALWVEMDKLPANQHSALIMAGFYGMELEAVAEIMGISRQAVQKQRNRAARTVRRSGIGQRIGADRGSIRHVGLTEFRYTFTSEAEKHLLWLEARGKLRVSQAE